MPDAATNALPPINILTIRNHGKHNLDVSADIEQRAMRLLDAHPHFRGRSRLVRCMISNQRLYLIGKVPSYYLKQLAQEAVRELKDVDEVVNKIEVVGSVVPELSESDRHSIQESREHVNRIKAR